MLQIALWCRRATKQQKHLQLVLHSIFVFLISFVLLAGFLPSLYSDSFVVALDDIPKITLQYPLGGETLTDTVTIRWNTQTKDGNDHELLIYCFYTTDDTTDWQRINDEPLSNTGSFAWSTIDVPDGYYRILIEAVNPSNAMGTDTSESFVIDNDKSDLAITTIRVTNTIQDTNWVKNGDDLEIFANIKGGTDLTSEDIWADFSAFSRGNMVTADSFDGTVASWLVEDISCSPSEGSVEITIVAHGLANKSFLLTADNTPPEMTIKKPVAGIYFFNKKVFPSQSIFIIGSLSIEVQLEDNIVVDRVDYYLNGILYETVDSSPYDLYINQRLKGRYTVKMIAYDRAGNSCLHTETMTIFNLFGKL